VSGQLVGEVIAAADALRQRGLSERGFHALIAIAEKASVDSRQASVPLRHICAGLYGDISTKKRTAERAIQDLKASGVIRVIRRGFNNGHGHAAAPIYEIGALTETVTRDGNDRCDTDTGDGHAETVPAKKGDRSRQNDDRSRHSSDGLNVFSNGKSNDARASRLFTGADKKVRHLPRGAPAVVDTPVRLPRCTGAGCSVCSIIRPAIDACRDCDIYGRLDDQTDCPNHGNFRQHPPKRRASA
jgi:hypothetical protein